MSDEKTAETLAEVKDEGVNLDAPKEVKEEAAKEPPKDDAKAEGQEGNANEAGDDAGEDKPKKPSGAQRAKAREQRLLNEIAERERVIEELRSKQQPAAHADGDAEEKAPREEDFNGDWFAWQRALTAHEAGKAARKAIKDQFDTRDQVARTTQQANAARERKEAHLERIEDAREVIADFDQAMAGMKGVNIRNEVIEEIMSSDKSALLSYHLAKNPDVLARLDGMSGRELAREMGRLEATLKMPAAKKQTDAPKPLEQLKGGASGSFDPAKASMDDYVAKRKAGWKG